MMVHGHIGGAMNAVMVVRDVEYLVVTFVVEGKTVLEVVVVTVKMTIGVKFALIWVGSVTKRHFVLHQWKSQTQVLVLKVIKAYQCSVDFTNHPTTSLPRQNGSVSVFPLLMMIILLTREILSPVFVPLCVIRTNRR
jgi:hypothetical protein